MATSHPEPSAPRVTVAILNWNGWEDTIACVDSVLRSDYPNYHVVICDNASSDGSPERIRDWAAGRLD
ncbi:MAG: glycosyltransferase, partial [Nitrococcus sp.]|nr:glycosyltransferase [Nitrococcus sp.]